MNRIDFLMPVGRLQEYDQTGDLWDKQSQSVFFEAARAQDRETLETAILAGAELNAQNSNGVTALIEAVRYDRRDSMETLMQAGANLEAVDAHGNTAFIIAAKYGKVDAMQVLMRAGAGIEAKDSEGDTALIWAARRGLVQVVDILVRAGVNVEAKNYREAHALLCAMDKEHGNVIDILVRAGARITSANRVFSQNMHQKYDTAVKRAINLERIFLAVAWHRANRESYFRESGTPLFYTIDQMVRGGAIPRNVFTSSLKRKREQSE